MRKYILLLGLLILNVNIHLLSANDQKITIMGLGDSITEGGNHFTSYLLPLWEMLKIEKINFEFIGPRYCKDGWNNIRCCGFSGCNVEYLNNLIEDVYKKYPADIVLLHAGHNHFIEEKPVPGMIRSYTSIINKILKINPEAHILVAQVIHSGKLPKYSYIPKLNKEIAALVKALDSDHVHLVDLSRSFNWKKHTVKDKVHPNTTGATVMAEEWIKTLMNIMN